MTHDSTTDRDEQRLAALLRAIDTDAPPPDRERLERLREQSSALFVSGTLLSVPDTFSSRKPPMLSLTLRGFAVLSAAVAGIAVWLGTWIPGSVSDAAPFSKVLDNLRQASTLQLELVKDDRSTQILVRAPGLVRKEDSPQRYEIAAGSRLWKVDEAANTVTEGDSPWYLSPDRQIDLLALLDAGVKDATPLLKARPKHREQYDGRECFVYRAELPAEPQPVEIVAFVDAATQRLAGIRACPVFPPDVAERVDVQCFGELRLIAMNIDVPDDKFIVAKSLTEDGRIGKVSDAQGLVTLRPMLAKRWTPVCRETLLKPGDWLRTELRGANAVKATLSSDVQLTLGPGTLVECIAPDKARIHTGEVQVSLPGGGRIARVENDAKVAWINLGDADFIKPRMTFNVYAKDTPGVGRTPADIKGKIEVTRVLDSHLSQARIIEEVPLRPITPGDMIPYSPGRPAEGRASKDGGAFELLAPREGTRSFISGDKRLVRVDRDEKLVDVVQTPVWLAGFEGTSANESLGSLIVNVDGRNEPLTVGYHKVSVEIRDQIARTTIEESFVNHTVNRLEGVFHFPLPQDASISGFGMWIGGDLIEADVVEKQRAREIYETILREKRDPGCWNGPAATSSRPACSPSRRTRRSGSRSSTRRCCRCARTATGTLTACAANCCARSRCGNCR